MKRVNVGLFLPPELKEKLRKVAEQKGIRLHMRVTLSDIVRECLDAHLDAIARQYPPVSAAPAAPPAPPSTRPRLAGRLQHV